MTQNIKLYFCNSDYIASLSTHSVHGATARSCWLRSQLMQKFSVRYYVKKKDHYVTFTLHSTIKVTSS